MPSAYQSLNGTQLAATARLFSPSILQEMARKGQSSMLSRLAQQSSLLDRVDDAQPLEHLFDTAFSLLKRKAYRGEYSYKAAITEKVLLGVHSLRTASMLNEFRVGSCKADIAILNGTATVYEIKSERDKLDRLESQISAYRNVFASVNIIAGENHLDEIIKIAPEDVGVMTLSKEFKISTIKEAENRPERVRPEWIFDAITKPEAVLILRSFGIESPAVPNTKLHGVLRELFMQLSPEEAHAGMVTVLKATRSMSSLADLVEGLPKSLRALVLSTNIRKGDHQRLMCAVKTPIKEAISWINY